LAGKLNAGKGVSVRIVHAGAIRPVSSFADVQAWVRESLAPINMAIGNDRPVGVSVRLSQAALADPLLTGANLKALLGEYGLNLAGISGVSISGGAKDQVHHPDWRTEDRLSFMFAASNLLAEVAEAGGPEPGITTNAFSHRRWLDVDFPGNWAALTLNLVRVVQHLATIRERTGITMHIDLEAEPGSVLRDTADIIHFWHTWLLGRGAAMLSDRMQVTDGTAADVLQRHVRLALDTAHAAVVWDDAATSLDKVAETGVGIGRLQVSSALEIAVPADGAARADVRMHLGQLQSDRLLQQVVATRDGAIVARYEDLPDAIAAIDGAAGETWRIHTHAPVLSDRYGVWRSTRDEAAAWLQETATRGMDVPMIELRSANWDVVPADDRSPMEQMVAREAKWVRSVVES
jgi:hypothetical protein